MPTPHPARSLPVERALADSLFVIPSINGGKLLRRMLPTLRLPLDTVVVLDQGSTDGTEAICREVGIQCVQLGRPHTYTEACNIGARMARRKGIAWLFVANNDIAFTTDVGGELMAEMLDDPRLGIVAPSQLIVDEKADQRFIAYRVLWHLDTMVFTHDLHAPALDTRRLEADFCELTCVLVRMSAVAEIGFLDDEYGFYYEDADFGFRLRQAGYAAAYLPAAQIEHYTSSTFSAGMSERKLAYIARNKELFARKHLGYGVARRSGGDSGWLTRERDRTFWAYLERFGLVAPDRPVLAAAHPGSEPSEYLYTGCPTPHLPEGWARYAKARRGIITDSDWSAGLFTQAHIVEVRHAPPGVETDVFHPWAAPHRAYDETTFLWFAADRNHTTLPVTLEAWAAFHADHPRSRLLVVGPGVIDALSEAPASLRRWNTTMVAEHPAAGLSLRDTGAPLSDVERAALFAGVDIVLPSAMRGTFDPTLAEAMACGTLAIIPGHGASRELAFAGAPMLGGVEVRRGLSTDGGGETGDRWDPEVGVLIALMRETYGMGGAARVSVGLKAARVVTDRFTWRDTCCGIRGALVAWQEQRDARPGVHLGAGAAAFDAVHDVAIGPDTDPVTPSRAARMPRRPAPKLAPPPEAAPVPAPTPVPISGGLMVRNVRRGRNLRRQFVETRASDGTRAAVGSLKAVLRRYVGLRARLIVRRAGLSPRLIALLRTAREIARGASPRH